MPTFPAPETGILLTHFIVSEDKQVLIARRSRSAYGRAAENPTEVMIRPRGSFRRARHRLSTKF